MGYYISIKVSGMKVHRPVRIINPDTGCSFIEKRIAMATVLSDRGEAEEMADIVSRNYPYSHCKILHTKEYGGMSLQAVRNLRC